QRLADHGSAAGAQRHANPQFIGPLGDGIRGHAEETDGCEQYSKKAEEAAGRSHHALPHDGLVDVSAHALDMNEQPRVYAPTLVPDSVCARVRISRGADL